MKIATYRDGSRDGQLVVVSRDLSQAHYATGIATRLQQVLDDWNFLSPQLEELSQTLNHGRARHAFAFEPQQCMAPLPRAYRWADVARPDAAADGEPVLRHHAADALAGPCEAIDAAQAGPDLDWRHQLAVVTGDVAAGTAADAALDAVRLVMLASGARRHAAADASQAWPPAFAPVAVTPDELGDAWRGGRLHLALQVSRNGRRVPAQEADAAGAVDAGRLIAALARAGRLGAGSIVGTGAGARPQRADAGGPGVPAAALQPGDALRVEVRDAGGLSLFGAIERRVADAAPVPQAGDAAA